VPDTPEKPVVDQKQQEESKKKDKMIKQLEKQVRTMYDEYEYLVNEKDAEIKALKDQGAGN
jgi:hypothetical protein